MRRAAAITVLLAISAILLISVGALALQRRDHARTRIDDRLTTLATQEALVLGGASSPGVPRRFGQVHALGAQTALPTMVAALSSAEANGGSAVQTLLIAPAGEVATSGRTQRLPEITSAAARRLGPLISSQSQESGAIEFDGSAWGYATARQVTADQSWRVAVSTGSAFPGVASMFSLTGLAMIVAAFLLVIAAAAALAGRGHQLQRSANTDQLTGLSNRRAMNRHLDLAQAQGEKLRLTLFDLNGFKAYNDTFGHQAGDALLARLGSALTRCVAPGQAYRLGGDEFCVISPISYADAVESRAEYALTDQGSGFTITASRGSVDFPSQASTMSEGLAMADERMYRVKHGRRSSALLQTKATLTALTAERDPELAAHHERVSQLAARVGSQLGLNPDEIGAIRDAAELHDIGLLAVPSSIRTKAGALDPDERAFLHKHAMIGARVLASADALQGPAAIVRASHEHWDGTGYPGRITGPAIPLGARILAVCDAYDTMTNRQLYRQAARPADAVRELQAQAGHQFDPALVAAFVSLVDAEDQALALPKNGRDIDGASPMAPSGDAREPSDTAQTAGVARD